MDTLKKCLCDGKESEGWMRYRLDKGISAMKLTEGSGLMIAGVAWLGVTWVSVTGLASLAHGQAGTGEIAGAVRDSTGAALPDVRLTLTEQRSMYSREVMTSGNGSYVAAALSAGEYSIKAELTNFRTQIREGIVLQVGRQERVDLVLVVGDQSEVVTVQEAAPLVNTSNAELGEVIGNERIVNLPLNGRQFVDLTLLSDNVFRAPRGTRGSALAQTGAAVLVGGQRAGSQYVLPGWRVGDGPVFQSSGGGSSGGCDSGIQYSEIDLCGRVWRKSVGDDQRGD